MEKYEALCPGATDRILKITEKSLKLTAQQSAHRQKLEAEALKASSRVSLIGVISAALIALTSLILTGFCVYIGHEIIGTILSGSTIASIVYAFIYGTNSNRQEREAKWQEALKSQQNIVVFPVFICLSYNLLAFSITSSIIFKQKEYSLFNRDLYFFSSSES
ncbi:MAG: DUF2335 domain-containing protein, partial [Synergistaceae bacterium]|nr:DUF2335 domain-containing protein [Synergistaceae bacterium]